MLSLDDYFLLAAALGSGLVAGLCYAFSSFLLASFDRLEPREAIRTMQSINAVILRSSAMLVWFGTLLVAGVAVFLVEERSLVVAGVVLYAVAAVLITGRGNVPLNEALDRVDADAAGADEVWRGYRRSWGRWNAMRTVLCVAASALFALAL